MKDKCLNGISNLLLYLLFRRFCCGRCSVCEPFTLDEPNINNDGGYFCITVSQLLIWLTYESSVSYFVTGERTEGSLLNPFALSISTHLEVKLFAVKKEDGRT